MRSTWVLALASVVLLTGCSLLPTGQAPPSETAVPAPPVSTPSTFTVNGTLTVEGNPVDVNAEGEPCVTNGGYSDIRADGQVEVQDASGTALAIGKLGDGGLDKYKLGCVFLFKVDDVPEGEDIYGIAIGKDGRGVPKYTREELKSVLELSLG